MPRRLLSSADLPRGQAELGRVVGVDLDERRRLALDELGRLARARQGVPVGVEPAGRQDQRELVVGRSRAGPGAAAARKRARPSGVGNCRSR